PASALLPELGRNDRRHQDLLRAGAIHLVPHDRLEAADGPQTEGEEVVDTARDLADHPGADEEPVAHDLGVRRVLARRREEEARETRHSAGWSSRHWSASPPWLQAAPAAMAMATSMPSPPSWSVAPALRARFACASMHQGHCVMCATPRAISSFVFTGSAPSWNAFPSKSRNAR